MSAAARVLRRLPPGVLEAARDLRARREVERCLAAAEPVVVYTAPKTGSTSIEAALAAAGLRAAKVHFLHRLHDRAEAHGRATGLARETHHFVEARLKARLPGACGRWRVLTLVRDPVAQRLSGAFQAPEVQGLDPTDARAVRRAVSADVERMAARGRPFRWFAEEIGLSFDVDPAAGFDAEAGAGRVSGRGAEILLLKTEALGRLGPAVSRFVGRPLALGHRNRRDATADAGCYRAVRDELRLPRATLDAIYADPLARAVYTPAELAGFRARWTA